MCEQEFPAGAVCFCVAWWACEFSECEGIQLSKWAQKSASCTALCSLVCGESSCLLPQWGSQLSHPRPFSLGASGLQWFPLNSRPQGTLVDLETVDIWVPNFALVGVSEQDCCSAVLSLAGVCPARLPSLPEATESIHCWGLELLSLLE